MSHISRLIWTTVSSKEISRMYVCNAEGDLAKLNHVKMISRGRCRSSMTATTSGLPRNRHIHSKKKLRLKNLSSSWRSAWTRKALMLPCILRLLCNIWLTKLSVTVPRLLRSSSLEKLLLTDVKIRFSSLHSLQRHPSESSFGRRRTSCTCYKQKWIWIKDQRLEASRMHACMHVWHQRRILRNLSMRSQKPPIFMPLSLICSAQPHLV